ncbi:MAG: hypothetical protein IBX43_05100 [Campylobacterales bacterium]|nr:hypothetical protein [Campylobacterales bacterium]
MGYTFDLVGKAGKWEVFIDSKEGHGYFEHDDYGEGGALKFEGKELCDYDGCFSLPKEVIVAIRELGCDPSYAEN